MLPEDVADLPTLVDSLGALLRGSCLADSKLPPAASSSRSGFPLEPLINVAGSASNICSRWRSSSPGASMRALLGAAVCREAVQALLGDVLNTDEVADPRSVAKMSINFEVARARQELERDFGLLGHPSAVSGWPFASAGPAATDGTAAEAAGDGAATNAAVDRVRPASEVVAEALQQIEAAVGAGGDRGTSPPDAVGWGLASAHVLADLALLRLVLSTAAGGESGHSVGVLPALLQLLRLLIKVHADNVTAAVAQLGDGGGPVSVAAERILGMDLPLAEVIAHQFTLSFQTLCITCTRRILLA